MVLKGALAAAFCTGLLMSGGPAMADEYRAGEFLGLDLSRAVLSPKRLGPETEFAPVPIEARTDRKQVKTERVVVPKLADRNPSVVEERAEKPRGAARTKLTTRRHGNPLDTPEVADRKERVVQERAEKPRGTARTKLTTQRRTNPLDAQARDTRIQTWPCKSGGICDWQR